MTDSHAEKKEKTLEGSPVFFEIYGPTPRAFWERLIGEHYTGKAVLITAGISGSEVKMIGATDFYKLVRISVTGNEEELRGLQKVMVAIKDEGYNVLMGMGQFISANEEKQEG